MSPFYSTYGYHPLLSFTTPSTSTVPVAEARIQHLQQVHEDIKTMIKIAGDQARAKYDKTGHLHHVFKIGDQVLLRHDNIATTCPSRKLAPKLLGPYLITKKFSDLVYRLKLPKTLKIHNVFHISALEKYNHDTIVGRQKKAPPPVVTPEGHIEWEVDRVLDSRIFGRWKKL